MKFLSEEWNQGATRTGCKGTLWTRGDGCRGYPFVRYFIGLVPRIIISCYLYVAIHPREEKFAEG